MKLVQYDKYLVNIVRTDGLVLWHQDILSYSVDYAPMHFQLFLGLILTFKLCYHAPPHVLFYQNQTTKCLKLSDASNNVSVR